MPLLLLPYSLLGWPTSSTAGMMPPYGAQGELRRITLPRTPVNTARTCGSHRGGDVSHDIEEAKIRGPNGVDGTMPFQKHQRNGAGGVGRGPKYERDHQRADQGAACRRPHYVQGGPRRQTTGTPSSWPASSPLT